MNYTFTMEELVPVAARLTEQYTSFDSTSVSYEKAEQLMGAVLYCIQEIGQTPQKSFGQEGEEKSEQGEAAAVQKTVVCQEAVTAQQAYEMGAALVKEKVKRTLEMYNQMRPELVCYGNVYLQDIFEKGLPGFFIQYDVRFEPQNTILTLDYPVLMDLSGYSGIDKIYEFMCCVRMEQLFLKKFPESFCQKALLQNSLVSGDIADNLCEAVFVSALGHILAEKPMSEPVFSRTDYIRIQKAVLGENGQEAAKAVKDAGEAFLCRYCREEAELFKYFSRALEDIAVRFKIAAEHGTLDALV